MDTDMRIVQKFGGTSVADINRIKAVAQRIKADVDAGHEVAVVVSAMAGVTNQLVEYCSSVSPLYDAREYDVVVSTGEQVTSGLLAMALQSLGVDARSWLGWQLPVLTDGVHGKARIESIGTDEILKRLAGGQVAVVPGFQGVDGSQRVTTLGRGGSDTSAVALAAALKADRCDIYTDVDGVYTTDPRIVPSAKKLNKITYEEMLNEPGTLVCDEEEIVEKEVVSGIAYSRDEAKVTLVGVEDRPGIAASIFGSLADANINVDMIVQNVSEDGTTDVTFTVSRGDLERAKQAVANADNISCREIQTDKDVVKVSVIGVGMRSHAGVAKTMFEALAEKSINIQVISTSEIKVSVLIAEEYTELALRSLHTAFGLDAA
jgi:aspartate kinase